MKEPITKTPKDFGYRTIGKYSIREPDWSIDEESMMVGLSISIPSKMAGWIELQAMTNDCKVSEFSRFVMRQGIVRILEKSE